ncbi:head-tail adaptor Ad2 [Pelagibacter phage HTVC008M]|jgi:hypothetical protein|uniref:head-tail adaptor Ad2 n=1 Tax=Pelagibacter phage HTVC008M TaxID=1283076 RepID=UPI0002B2A2A7|nr:head-tail adaptor Ad2 [Pelagibacter phage HTVC008M]AGE60407.1 neck protein [Pelagibacter phage HTVC008M]|tara:strand:+ start:705 stop:1532 length:828 start_codon:yes stop_codon:yes gene_type:complete
MAQNNPITSRETLKQYCLRALGKPVIEINVEDDQVEDRIDEAVQYFAQYHYDGSERMYLKYQVTADDITRARSNETLSTVTDTADSTVTSSFKEGKNYIPMPSNVMSVLQVFPFTDKAALNLFDVRYQLRLNDLYDFSSTSIIHYDMTLRHLDMLDHILTGERPIRYNQHKNRLYIDMDWAHDVKAGDYLIIECYRKLDGSTFTDLFDDIFLKKYLIQLIKKQWGTNLSKFQGVAMLGGVQMNGEQIYSQAQEEINKLEEQIQLSFELPPNYMVG